MFSSLVSIQQNTRTRLVQKKRSRLSCVAEEEAAAVAAAGADFPIYVLCWLNVVLWLEASQMK